MSRPSSKVAVCVPTVGRPEAVERLLESLLRQQHAPDVILIVDASEDAYTAEVCDRLAHRFPPGVLKHVRSTRGLTRQRRVGIDLLRVDGDCSFVCMLDDDVVLEPGFLAEAVGFLSAPAGRAYGGVSGYDTLGWGRPFDSLTRFYGKVRLFDGELRPGRWLYCGRFLELSRLETLDGVYDTEFIGGGLTVWRMEVFDHFQPPTALGGYALLEDKHLSLRVGSRFKLGVLGSARLRHERAVGGRPMRAAMAFAQVRNEALLLRDCDARPTLRRYLAFMGFTVLDLLVQLLLSIGRLRLRDLPRIAGRALGWLSCVNPPGPSPDALAAARGRDGDHIGVNR